MSLRCLGDPTCPPGKLQDTCSHLLCRSGVPDSSQCLALGFVCHCDHYCWHLFKENPVLDLPVCGLPVFIVVYTLATSLTRGQTARLGDRREVVRSLDRRDRPEPASQERGSSWLLWCHLQKSHSLSSGSEQARPWHSWEGRYMSFFLCVIDSLSELSST